MPDSRRRLLILGGTAEARQLADALGRREPDSRSSPRSPAAPRRRGGRAGEVRVGGFGGAEGLLDYLRGAKIDAGHRCDPSLSPPRSAAMPWRPRQATGRPLLRLERAAWQAEAGDRWIEVDSLAAAAAGAPRPRPARLPHHRRQGAAGLRRRAGHLVPGAAGRRAGGAAAAAVHEHHARARPFAAEASKQLLREHHIDLVIAKNSGGDATYGKIAAARELGLPVMLLRRPALPPAETAGSIEAAVGWVGKLLG